MYFGATRFPMTGIVIAIVFFLLLIGFLFSPIVVYIDTEKNRYVVTQFPVICFSIRVEQNFLTPHFKLLGLNIPITKKEKAQPPPKTKQTKSSKFKKSIHAWRFLAENMMRSFTLKKFVLDLDTDDVVLNAQLVPLFLFASGGLRTLTTNFNGRVYLHLHLQNHPARLLWIFIQFLTKK